MWNTFISHVQNILFISSECPFHTRGCGNNISSIHHYSIFYDYKGQSQSKLNPNQIQIHSIPFFCTSFILCFPSQPELCGSYHLHSLAFLFSSVSMTNLSRLVAASFSSLALLSSSVSIDNPNCLLARTFSSLRLLSNSLSSSRFYLLRVGKRCYSWFSVFLFSHLILSISFLCSSITEALFALSFSFLSDCFFFVHAKAALA